METQELLNKKIQFLKDQGLSAEEVSAYIADVIELAFVKTMSKKVDALSDESYNKIVASLDKGSSEDALNELFTTDEVSETLDEKIFALNLKEALEVK